MTILFWPILVAGATEIVKFIAEFAGPQWTAIATKAVATGMAFVLTALANAHLPIDLGPFLTPLSPLITAALITWGAQVLHDLATAIAKWAGITVPVFSAVRH